MLDLSIFNPNTQCKTQPPICLRAFKACDYSTERLRSADVRMLCSIRRHLHFGSPKNQVGIKKKMIKAWNGRILFESIRLHLHKASQVGKPVKCL